MAFFAMTWWIWLIVSLVCVPLFFGAIFGTNPRNAGKGMLLFISSMIVFAISSLFWVVGVIAALIGYAKG